MSQTRKGIPDKLKWEDALTKELIKFPKTYVFKPEFEAKLKLLRVKTKFIANIKATSDSDSDFNGFCNYLNNSHDWFSFIATAFYWQNTPEGHIFWRQIAFSVAQPKQLIKQ